MKIVIRNQKIKCECGCVVSRRRLYSHKKTQKHKDNMENLKKK